MRDDVRSLDVDMFRDEGEVFIAPVESVGSPPELPAAYVPLGAPPAPPVVPMVPDSVGPIVDPASRPLAVPPAMQAVLVQAQPAPAPAAVTNELRPIHAPGTIIDGSPDPKTAQQRAALQAMQTTDGSIGSQYAGLLLLPNGTRTRDMGALVKPAARVSEIDAALTAGGKPTTLYLPGGETKMGVSGGYILILDVYGIPVQYVGCSAVNVQTVREQVQAEIAVGAGTGYSREQAIRAAEKGVQTDGEPVTSSYLDLMEKWSRESAIPFTRPSAAVIAAASRPASAAVVTTSGQGVAATPVASPFAPQPVQTVGVQPAMPSPTFTQGAVMPMTQVLPVLREAVAPAGQPGSAAAGGGAPPAMTIADTATAPAKLSVQDAGVQARDNTMLYVAAAAVVVLAIATLGRD